MKRFEKMSVRSRLTVIGLVIAVAAAVVAITGLRGPGTVHPMLIPPTSYSINFDRDLKEETMRAEIGGRVFQIPIKYIESHKPKDGVFKDGILLEVIWPDMTTIYDLKTKEEYDRIWRDEKRLGWVLLEPASKRPSLDEQLANKRHGLGKEEFVKNENGLETFRHYDPRPEGMQLQNEIHVEKDKNGKIITYITCGRRPGVRFPSCRQKFIENGILYQISYNEANFISEWREQAQRIIKLMLEFEIKS